MIGIKFIIADHGKGRRESGGLDGGALLPDLCKIPFQTLGPSFGAFPN